MHIYRCSIYIYILVQVYTYIHIYISIYQYAYKLPFVGVTLKILGEEGHKYIYTYIYIQLHTPYTNTKITTWWYPFK
jgi:hypothetical protein